MEVFLDDPSEAETLEESVEAEFLLCPVVQAGLVLPGRQGLLQRRAS
ncbi:MAG: hypothetical protein SOH58_07915 [Olsenella sp.]|jgi:hypothetical protein